MAVATRESAASGPLTAGDEQELTLAGFLAFVDRPKADAGASIAKLERLGIAVKVITGDNGTVAVKVCRDLGVDVDAEQVLTGAELERLDDDALVAAIPRTGVLPCGVESGTTVCHSRADPSSGAERALASGL